MYLFVWLPRFRCAFNDDQHNEQPTFQILRTTSMSTNRSECHLSTSVRARADRANNEDILLDFRDLQLGIPRQERVSPQESYIRPKSSQSHLSSTEIEAQAIRNSEAASRALLLEAIQPFSLSRPSELTEHTPETKADFQDYLQAWLQSDDDSFDDPTPPPPPSPLPHLQSAPRLIDGKWRQPKFVHSKLIKEYLEQERIKPIKFGGRSKKDQLGSVAECWGTETKRKGMFAIEDSSPSRSCNPFKTAVLEEAKENGLKRVRLGTEFENIGKDFKTPANRSREDVLVPVPATPQPAPPVPCPDSVFAGPRRPIVHPPSRTFDRSHDVFGPIPARLEITRR